MPGEKLSDQHPDWKVFKDAAARGTVFTRIAYDKAEDQEQMQDLAKFVPEGYELFLMTDHLEDSKEASFRCVAFINHENKEIVFATAGTRLGLNQKGFDDLRDDALLTMHYEPKKMESARALNDIILDSLGQEAKDYNFHYTGHSLGAAMAEMQAADMDIKLRQRDLKRSGDKEQLSAVTFENPGTKPVIEKMYKKAGVPVEEMKNLNFCEFNNRSNIINSLNEQTGHTYEIVPDAQKERNPSSAQMVFEYIAKYASKLSPMLGKVFSLLAPGGIDSELVKEHALTNFDEVFVQNAGSVKEDVIPLEKAYSGVMPIEYNEGIASNISNLQKTNGKIGKQEFSMTSRDPETQEVSRVVCSKEELKHALGKLRTIETKQTGSMVDRVTKKVFSTAKKEVAKLKLPSASEVVKEMSRSIN